jgi:hypothetical protein
LIAHGYPPEIFGMGNARTNGSRSTRKKSSTVF